MKDKTVKKHLESYGSIYLGYDGSEASRPAPMTEKQAIFLSKQFHGFVVDL